jgi:hypothetical protein
LARKVDYIGQYREVPGSKPEVSHHEKEHHYPDRCYRYHPCPWRRHLRSRRKDRFYLLPTGPGLLPGKAGLLQVTINIGRAREQPSLVLPESQSNMAKLFC